MILKGWGRFYDWNKADPNQLKVLEETFLNEQQIIAKNSFFAEFGFFLSSDCCDNNTFKFILNRNKQQKSVDFYKVTIIKIV